jgi:tRNA pseudouridine13 synthase
LELSQLKIKGIREMFFSKGERAAQCRPVDLVHAVGSDELNAGRRKLILQFDLPRGSYATLLIKRLDVTRVSTGAP